MSSASPVITIPAVTATHVLGKSEVDLGHGDLTIILTQPAGPAIHAEEPNNSDSTPLMALTVGKAAFPLFKATDFGTLAGDERVYVFAPQVGEKVGYVKITLPDGVKEEGSELAKLQEDFERILVDHGLLKDGVAATGDAVGRNVQEHAGRAARNVRAAATEYLAENPPTKDPATFTDTTHSVSSASVPATQTIFDAASKVGTAVGSAASSAGAWVTDKVTPSTHENANTLDDLGYAYNASTGGIASGSIEMKNTVTEAAGQVVENDYGGEAREVGGNLVGSVGNVSRAMGHAAGVVSGATVVGGGLKGVASAENRQQLKAEPGKREERPASGQWQDVPV